MKKALAISALAIGVATTPFACSAGAPAAPFLGAAAGAPPFPAVPPAVYVAKVKDVLVGLAPTDEEVRAVAADPSHLGALVDEWMRLPEYERKMTRFFALAFQQTQVVANDFADVVHGQPSWNDAVTPSLLENAQESFARTVFALTSQGRPLSEAMTTKQLMMTTAMKELYAFLDTVEIDDDSATFDHFRQQYIDVPIVAEAAAGPIPIEQSVDPASPNFMRWYDPDVATAGEGTPGCQVDPMLLPVQAITVHWLILGSIDGRTLANGKHCPLVPGSARAPQLGASDFHDWTMVTMRAPGPGEATTAFFDVPKLRAANELVLRMPRAGFFSTPAFAANWPTNVSNQMRVAANQALIVATGASIDGTDPTVPPSTPGLDATHAQAACVACHRTLDPTRSILSATWSWNYHGQQDPAWTSQPGLFAFRGVVRPVATIDDFGAALASHPLLAAGWTQKLCTYVNSAPCDESDPELARLVALFESSGLQWGVLVKALLTSPITTYTAATKTADTNGEVIAVARRDHLCATLDARLGLDDVCGLDPTSGGAPSDVVPAIVAGLPSDAYGRGSVAPILPNQPTLFFRAGLEGICEAIASRVVDPSAPPSSPRAARWSSAAPDAAIADLVARLMALPASDARAAPAAAILRSHFTSALAQPGTTPTDALRSTFTVACLAPSTISIGL